jgi:hypothetical protein
MSMKRSPTRRTCLLAALVSGAVALPGPVMAATPPDPPASVSARAGVNAATVSWAAPASDGGAPVTGYTALSDPGGKACATTGSLTCMVTGLTNGQAYTFTVVATNAAGDSVPAGPTDPVTPQADTSRPHVEWITIEPAWVSTATGGKVTLEARIVDEIAGLGERSRPLIGFDLWTDIAVWESSRVSGDRWDGVYRATATILPGAKPGEWRSTVWSYGDTAGNSGLHAYGPTLLVGFPAAPSSVVATTAADRSVTLTWDAPDDGGSVITGYVVETSDGMAYDTTGTTWSHSYPERAADDPITFTVRARNSVGLGLGASSEPVMIPASAPAAPALAGAGVRGLDLTGSWYSPVPDGGSPVTSYTLTATPGGATCTTTTHQCTITGVPGGEAYTLSVTATNAAGTSAASNPSHSLFAEDVPPAVTSVGFRLAKGTRLSGTKAPVLLTWAGSDAGGSGFGSFRISWSIGGSDWLGREALASATSKTYLVDTVGTIRYRVDAWDHADNWSAPVYTPTLSPRLVQQTSKSLKWSSGWSTVKSSAYSGSSTRYARAAGRSVSYRFTGRGIALVTTMAKSRGKVRIYLDGVSQGTVDLFSSTTRYRVLAWQKTWGVPGAHTLKVVVLGTTGRPRVDIDAFAVLR